MFGTLSDSTPQKIGIISWGLLAGCGTTLLTCLLLCLLGFIPSLLVSAGWMQPTELQAWLPIAGLIYGVFPGLVIGATVCWRFCRSRLQKSN